MTTVKLNDLKTGQDMFCSTALARLQKWLSQAWPTMQSKHIQE